MRIQAFVTTWDTVDYMAGKTADLLSQHCSTVFMSSMYNRPFAEQWDYAVKMFSGDVFLWVMGDVTPPMDLSGFLNKTADAYATGKVAMYAPNIDWTSQIYRPDKLPEWGLNVYEVCGTDLLMTSASRELLDIAPSIVGNTRGWLYDYALTAYAESINKLVLRDYNFLAFHPRGSNYDMGAADADARKWLDGLPFKDQRTIRNLQAEQARLCS